MANKLHIDNWITRAEPDYYTMFIKAWIPFNAWYVDKYPDLYSNDSKIIKELIASKNDIKAFINSLLSSTDSDYNRFSYHLSQLHIELEKKGLQHRNEAISFTSLFFEDYACEPVNETDTDGINYQASQPSKIQTYYRALIVKEKKTYLSIKMPEYDLNTLLTHEEFVGLAKPEMKEIIKSCFVDINPKQKVNLTTKSISNDEYLLIDNNENSRFKNDKELIAKSLIKVLYYLRCMLFHGELNPSDNNSVVYEHAFQILKYIVKKIQ
ncbi:hypothetical protein GO495_05995 [Chitinophaga oryziterrae]|uniref:Apea-like HEPN domain-containing protein n=1 Tax=Chitinophaga oryziterrae TaxID=1031224 RepID=A0A6N8J774_9BACT|nr:hypothetical protein [Chitinophaga oryziterrae]MVT40126.1 hypothetical protein [Chitinophaga oryziterrae]